VTSEIRTSLSPERQPLVGYIGCSFVLHLGVVGMALVSPFGALLASAMIPSCGEPVIHPSIEISVVSLPKRLNVPDRAARVKTATGDKTPTPQPPPIKQSDLVIHKDEPDPKTGNTNDSHKQEDIDDQKRRELLNKLTDAPVGPKDRNPTDPNGTAKDMENAVLGAQAQGDPEFARWVKSVKDLVESNFHPLGSQGDISCTVVVKIDASSGTVESHEVTRGSGVMAFDMAAERAIDETPKLPLPPEKYRPLVADEGVPIRFSPP